MYKKNKIALCIVPILVLLLFMSSAVAQEIGKTYALTLNYKKQLFVESFSLIGLGISEGTAPDYSVQPINGYKLDIISDSNQLLKSLKFSIPTSAIMLKGFTNEQAQGTPDNLNFTISIPYFSNGNKINVYNKDNNKVLEIPIDVEVGKNQPTIEIEGELEVIHADDFNNPQNSKFIFYLRSGEKRYELKYDKQLPVMLSGTLVKVTGKVIGNKIFIDSSSTKPFEIIQKSDYESKSGLGNTTSKASEQKTSQLAEGSQQKAKIEQSEIIESPKRNLNWLYIVAPILLIFGFLAYIEVNRKKAHIDLIRQHKEQSIISLRNYVTTNLRKGYSKKQIRNALVKNNYNNQEIEEAFSGLR